MLFQHFDWNLTHQVLFLYILPSHHMNLRDQPWKMLILWCRTFIATNFLQNSLMLVHPFLVASLCKLNHISLCFIQISTKSPASCLFPSWKAIYFLKLSPVFWPLGKFQNNKFLLRRPVFSDYLFLVTMFELNIYLAEFVSKRILLKDTEFERELCIGCLLRQKVYFKIGK